MSKPGGRPVERLLGSAGLRLSRGAEFADHVPRDHRGAAPAERWRAGEALDSLHQKNALAAGLPIEQPVGLVGLVELPAIRKQMVDVDLVVGDKARAIGLDGGGKGPRCNNGKLLAQHVGADLDSDVAAFADETGGAPFARGTDGDDAAGGGAGCIERDIGAQAGVRSLIAAGASLLPGSIRASAPNSLARASRSALTSSARRARPSPRRTASPKGPGTLADKGDGVAAGEIDPPQRLVGGAGAAGDRRAGGE